MSQELDLREYLNIVMKRIWMILAIVVVVTALAGIYSVFFKKPVYEASTKIIVNRTADSTPVAAGQLDLNEINTNIRMIDTYKEIIKTPAIMDIVAAQYPEFHLTAEQLMNKVSVSSVNNTQVMTLVVRDLSYSQAAEIVNAVSVTFQKEIPSLFNVKNVSILNKAKINAEPDPVSPNIPLNIAIAFVVSLMAAIGIAFLLEYLDDTIKTESDVQRYLELPIIAEITKFNLDDKKAVSAEKSSVKAGELGHVPVGK